MSSDYKPLLVFCDLSTMSCNSTTVDETLKKHSNNVVKITDSFWFITIHRYVGFEYNISPQGFISEIALGEYCDDKSAMLVCDISNMQFLDYWIPDDIHEEIKQLIDQL